jgi:hypothetical protein
MVRDSVDHNKSYYWNCFFAFVLYLFVLLLQFIGPICGFKFLVNLGIVPNYWPVIG